MRLNSALLGAIAVAVLAGMIPAGIALDRRLASSLIERARSDLETAPRLLADRNAAYSDALMMRAKDLAHVPGLAEAVERGDRPAVLSVLEGVRASLGAAAPLVESSDTLLRLGTRPEAPLVALTRLGKMPVKLCTDGITVRNVALAPLEVNGRWVGAAGVSIPFDDDEVIGLKGLSRADVIVTSSHETSVSATTLDPALAAALLAASRALPRRDRAEEVTIGGARYLIVRGALADAGSVIFVRSIAQETAVLPALRHTAMLAGAGGVAVALLLGALLARRLSRPVRQLSAAVEGVRAGRFDTALPESRILEVAAVAEQFDEMRRVLRTRLVELRQSNEALQDRSERLAALQSDLMQRERLAAAGRLVAQLAHEIRNPVAALRNCLEVLRRRLAHDREGVEFADLAINELLRMHELAEQMLDVGRPRANAVSRCAPVIVARDVVRLVTAGVPVDEFSVTVSGDAQLQAAMAPDALKQVLLNLIQNAREAFRPREDGAGALVDVVVASSTVDETAVTVAVQDNGPGIAEGDLARVFDPFFSTKSDMQGVGLGLFVAEGLVRSAGGRLSVGHSPHGGAQFVIVLPRVATAEPQSALPSGQLTGGA